MIQGPFDAYYKEKVNEEQADTDFGTALPRGVQLVSDGTYVYFLKSDGFVYRVFLQTNSAQAGGSLVITGPITNEYQYAQIYELGGTLYGIGTGGNLRAILQPNSMLGLGASPGYPTGTQVSGVAFDGQYIWVSGPGQLLVLNPSPNLFTAPSLHAVYTLGNVPAGPLLFDGQNLWMRTSGNLVKINRNTGALGDRVGSGITGSFLFDGSFLWFANGQNSLSKYDPGTNVTSTTL